MNEPTDKSVTIHYEDQHGVKHIDSIRLPHRRRSPFEELHDIPEGTNWTSSFSEPSELVGKVAYYGCCVEAQTYWNVNHEEDGSVSPLPTLPINLGRSLGKRAYKSERQKAKARVGMLKTWVESPIDTTRQRNQGRNSEA